MKDFYYTVHEWMFKDLKLSGSELTIYAVIYRYANVDNQYFKFIKCKSSELYKFFSRERFDSKKTVNARKWYWTKKCVCY